MKRTYNPFVDNGLFVAEYLLKKDYKDITIADIENNIDFLSFKLAELIEENEFYGNIVYSTHMNSSFTQLKRNKSRKDMIEKQLDEIINNIGNDKYCIYCGEKQVNKNYIIDRKFMPGIVANTFFNSANNLQTVDICPVCVFFSMLSIMNIQKIGLPTFYISDSDMLMRRITQNIQEAIATNTKVLNVEGKERYKRLAETALIDVALEDIGYLTRVSFQNGGQVVDHLEETLTREKINIIRKLSEEEVLGEFLDFGLMRRLINSEILVSNLLSDNQTYLSEKLFKILEEYELKEREKQIVEYATNKLIKLESLETLIKDFKLINTKEKFTDWVMKYSEKEPLVENIEDFDKLTGYDWRRFKNYIQMNLILEKNKREVI